MTQLSSGQAFHVAGAAGQIIRGNHAFNCAHPFTAPSAALEQATLAVAAFLREHLIGE